MNNLKQKIHSLPKAIQMVLSFLLPAVYFIVAAVLLQSSTDWISILGGTILFMPVLRMFDLK